MEAQNKASIGGVEGRNGREKEVGVANRRAVRWSEKVLRVLALVLTLVAAVVVGVDKQTKVVPVTLGPSLPTVNVAATAKWHYMSAFVYFVVANAIASSYAGISLILTLANRSGKKGLSMLIIILDLVMIGLLFSGNGAATAVGVLGYEGNSHVQWNKVCNMFGKFCQQISAAIILSLLASVVFLLLVGMAAFNLHKKSK
ncbi:unnamed protein product [Ilex paraguariensis]|uniref:CASP-like protein n=1 Tax=Ilex paraguariensis TaxID=185542 RepID=A0ABC8RR84_9AQUA